VVVVDSIMYKVYSFVKLQLNNMCGFLMYFTSKKKSLVYFASCLIPISFMVVLFCETPHEQYDINLISLFYACVVCISRFI
jgi:hypothetical protein